MKNNWEEIEKQTTRKAKKRDKKKKPEMKISGKGVFRLRQLMLKKTKKK